MQCIQRSPKIILRVKQKRNEKKEKIKQRVQRGDSPLCKRQNNLMASKKKLHLNKWFSQDSFTVHLKTATTMRNILIWRKSFWSIVHFFCCLKISEIYTGNLVQVSLVVQLMWSVGCTYALLSVFSLKWSAGDPKLIKTSNHSNRGIHAVPLKFKNFRNKTV